MLPLAMMRQVATKTAYLEMRAPPFQSLQPPVENVVITKLAAPTVARYRFLYNSVGRDFDWVDRDIMTDDKLAAIIQDRRVEIFELHLDGRSAGFAELDRRQPPAIEIAYFGLFPAHIGSGVGRYFLSWTVERAWSYQPKRVWVPTCDLDHPAALPTYLRRLDLRSTTRKSSSRSSWIEMSE